ncbi:MAG: response regulator [Bacteroidetes bacterium]|nr:response regulator [Bacteroidota bacterium]
MAEKNNKYDAVLLIDDNEIDNFINQRMIKSSKFSERIYVNTSARSAMEFLNNLSRAKGIPSEFIPKVILLDINMPIMDGFQFLEEFDKLPEDLKDGIKIAMLTTSINPSDLDRSNSDSRIIKYINKPLTAEHLKVI